MNYNDSKSKLHTKIHAVWRRHQMLHGVFGTLVLIKWFILPMATCVLVDWFVDMPAWVRGILLSGIIIFAALKAWRLGWTHLKSFDPVQNA
jgi:hypothetical protein